jgi:hypothetical protein
MSSLLNVEIPVISLKNPVLGKQNPSPNAVVTDAIMGIVIVFFV